MNHYDETTGFAICQVCGKPFNKITPLHLKSHNMTIAEYKEKFPEAPITGKSYGAILKAKRSLLFTAETNETNEVKEEWQDVVYDAPEHVPTRFPQIEELEKQVEELKVRKKLVERERRDVNPFETYFASDAKKELFEQLLAKFPDLRNNFFVEKVTPLGHLVYRYVTDMADPVRKIVFDFPNTFWHNSDPTAIGRNTVLEKDGWTVIEVRSPNPSLAEVLRLLRLR